jgi:Flp pilus assembly protein TadD
MPEPSADPLRLGRQLEREGRLDEAADAYRESVRQQPGDITARIRLGLLLRQAGRDDEANAVFGEALQLHVPVDVG